MARTPKFDSSMSRPSAVNNQGKGSKSQMLPSRHALDTLTKGDPSQRTLGMYSKLTPIGAGAPGRYADIQHMGMSFGGRGENGPPKTPKK